MNNIACSIVIPAYNEGARLAATMEKVIAYVHEQNWAAEIIVVNDGSTDNTARIVQEFAEKDPHCPADLKEHIASLVCIYWGSQQDQRTQDKIEK